MAKKKKIEKELKTPAKLDIVLFLKKRLLFWQKSCTQLLQNVGPFKISLDELHTAVMQYADEHGEYPDVQLITNWNMEFLTGMKIMRWEGYAYPNTQKRINC